MRLPWVSRAAFDLSQHNNKELHRLVIEHADERYERLLTMYHEVCLRVLNQPASPVQSVIHAPDDLPSPPRERSIVQETIREEAEGNPHIARHLHKRARELRSENMSPADIAQELRKWNTTEV